MPYRCLELQSIVATGEEPHNTLSRLKVIGAKAAVDNDGPLASHL